MSLLGDTTGLGGESSDLRTIMACNKVEDYQDLSFTMNCIV